mgnify:CR=1 FL=1|jgi:hypothetical protein
MDITELKQNDRRLEIALEGFESGSSIVYENVRFQITSAGTLEVNSYSTFSNPSQINSEMAAEGIDRAKNVLAALCESHPDYRPIIEGTTKEYYFCCDYHTGAVALAKEVQGTYQWLK